MFWSWQLLSLCGVLVESAATEVEIPEFLDGFPKGKRLKNALMCFKCIQTYMHILYTFKIFVHMYINILKRWLVVYDSSYCQTVAWAEPSSSGWNARVLRFRLDPVTSSDPCVDVAGDISCWLSHEKVYYATNLHLEMKNHRYPWSNQTFCRRFQCVLYMFVRLEYHRADSVWPEREVVEETSSHLWSECQVLRITSSVSVETLWMCTYGYSHILNIYGLTTRHSLGQKSRDYEQSKPAEQVCLPTYGFP